MRNSTWIFCDGDPWDLYTPSDPLDEDEGKPQTWEEFLISIGGRRVDTSVEFDLPENPVIHHAPGLSKYLAGLLDEGTKRATDLMAQKKDT